MNSHEEISILFDESKRSGDKESINCSKWLRLLKDKYQVTTNKNVISSASLQQNNLVIFLAPTKEFTSDEKESIYEYINQGGNVLFITGESSENASQHVVNSISSQYGIECTLNGVIRVSHKKYSHPKEALITRGICFPELETYIGESEERSGKKSKEGNTVLRPKPASSNATGVTMKEHSSEVLYPYGVALQLSKKKKGKVLPLLESGLFCHPLNAPLAAISVLQSDSERISTNAGKVLVLGSAHMVMDSYIEKEKNQKFLDAMIGTILGDVPVKANLNKKQEDLYFSKLKTNMNISILSDSMKPCFQECEPIPCHFSKLDTDPYASLNLSLLPSIISAYKTLDVPKEPLTLIAPDVNVPLPPYQPAVYNPLLKDVIHPALELFDLDSHYASEVQQLNELCYKCGENDTDLLIKRASNIFGIDKCLGKKNYTSKEALLFVVQSIVKFKRRDDHL